jgi:flagellin
MDVLSKKACMADTPHVLNKNQEEKIMRIQHNISALNAARQLNSNSNSVSKNIEKLSSGYRINNAADDAAGLAISEKMRSQISGLDQATSNANDGISLVQTAEGGLNETTSILQRMKELATQSSNGTYQNDVDRENIQKEVTSLQSEIDRISTSTNFNNINLLDGSLGGSSSTSSAGKAATLGLSDLAKSTGAYDMTAASTGVYTSGDVDVTNLADGDSASYSVSYTDVDGNKKTASVTLTLDATAKTLTDSDGNVVASGLTGTGGVATAGELADGIAVALNKNTDFAKNFNAAQATSAVAFTAKTSGANGAVVTGINETDTLGAVAQSISVSTPAADAYESVTSGVGLYDGTSAEKSSDYVFTVNNQKFAYVSDSTAASKLDTDVNYIVVSNGTSIGNGDATNMADLISQKTGVDATVAAGGTATSVDFKKSATSASNSTGALTLQIGASATSDQQVSLSINDMSSKGLGLSGISVSTQEGAQKAIGTIATAINTVSGTRADLGALQNRLEHTVSNLGVTSENLTSAESRIRDVDMATEMMEETKNTILTSAAQSMLAAANSAPRNILQLLQG